MGQQKSGKKPCENLSLNVIFKRCLFYPFIKGFVQGFLNSPEGSFARSASCPLSKALFDALHGFVALVEMHPEFK